MASSYIGVKRVRNAAPLEDGVVVRDTGGNELELPESEYRSRGCKPSIESLPWGKG